MEGLSLLSSAAKGLWDAVQCYQGNEVNLKQLAKIVNNTLQLARSANVSNIPEAAGIVRSLTDYINQGQRLVEKVNKTSVVERVLKMAKLRDELDTIISGIRDSLIQLTAANSQMSQQHMQAFTRIRGDLEVYWGSQQQAIAHLVQIQDGLELLQAGSAARHERIMQIMQAVLERLDLAPQKLAAEVQGYTSSEGSSSGGTARDMTSSDRQVRLHAVTVLSC